jgi:hypothetical protein
LNCEQIPELFVDDDVSDWHQQVLIWMDENVSDVQVCDCCGNGESWKSECPGYHDDDEAVIECL